MLSMYNLAFEVQAIAKLQQRNIRVSVDRAHGTASKALTACRKMLLDSTVSRSNVTSWIRETCRTWGFDGTIVNGRQTKHLIFGTPRMVTPNLKAQE